MKTSLSLFLQISLSLSPPPSLSLSFLEIAFRPFTAICIITFYSISSTCIIILSFFPLLSLIRPVRKNSMSAVLGSALAAWHSAIPGPPLASLARIN